MPKKKELKLKIQALTKEVERLRQVIREHVSTLSDEASELDALIVVKADDDAMFSIKWEYDSDNQLRCRVVRNSELKTNFGEMTADEIAEKRRKDSESILKTSFDVPYPFKKGD